MRFYYFIGRLLRPFGLVGLHAYSILTRTHRVRVVVENERSEVLLIRTWLSGGRWGLPGGGIHHKEKPEAAALRELEEETGMGASKEMLQPFTIVRSAWHDEIIFRLSVPSGSLPSVSPSKYEVKDMAWFSPSKLPPLESLAKKIMSEVASSG